ncbi:MAG: outer membrane beta-barrel protein [Thermonemataceae bacterium]
MKKINLLVFAIMLLCVWQVSAQKSDEYWYAGGGIGIANYFGDLAPTDDLGSTNLSFTRPSFNAFIGKRLNQYVSVEAELAYQRLIASDFENADPRNVQHRYRYLRNANFRNDIFEFDVRLTIDLIPSRREYYRRARYRPYLFAGIGVIYHNPRGQTVGGDWVRLQPLRTEGQGLQEGAAAQAAGVDYPDRPYSLIQPTIPLGVGLKYKINDRIDLAFEVGYRYLFTDYIDDVSGVYADASDLASQVGNTSVELANRTVETVDPISGDVRNFQPVAEGIGGLTTDALGRPTVVGFGNVGDQRGESNDLDIYIVTGFKLHIILNTGVKCPKFRR